MKQQRNNPNKKAELLLSAVKKTFETQMGSAPNQAALTIAYSTDQG